MGCFTRILKIHIICYKLFVRCIFAILMFRSVHWNSICVHHLLYMYVCISSFTSITAWHLILFINRLIFCVWCFKMYQICLHALSNPWEMKDCFSVWSFWNGFILFLEAIDLRLLIFSNLFANLYVCIFFYSKLFVFLSNVIHYYHYWHLND